MALTLLNIYNSVASQAWSMFDDEVETKAEFENVLISSINKALSDLWCSTDFPFRRRTEEIILMEDSNEYELPDGNLVPRNINGKKGFMVSIDGEFLDYIETYTPSKHKGKPTAYYIDNNNIYFSPTPDQNYEVSLDYFTLAIGTDEKGNSIYALNNEADSIDVPEKFEELFKNALITKTMLYAIASDSDENYSNYKKQFDTAYKLLLKYSTGKPPERKVLV